MTSREEVFTTSKQQFKLEEFAVSLRNAYGGTQTDTMRLSVEATQKLLVLGKVRIGWSAYSAIGTQMHFMRRKGVMG